MFNLIKVHWNIGFLELAMSVKCLFNGEKIILLESFKEYEKN